MKTSQSKFFHEKWFDPATISLNIIHFIQFSLMLLRRQLPPTIKYSGKFSQVFSVDAFAFFFLNWLPHLGAPPMKTFRNEDQTNKQKKVKRITVEQIYTFFSWHFHEFVYQGMKIHRQKSTTIEETKTFVTMTGKYSIVDCWTMN